MRAAQRPYEQEVFALILGWTIGITLMVAVVYLVVYVRQPIATLPLVFGAWFVGTLIGWWCLRLLE